MKHFALICYSLIFLTSCKKDSVICNDKITNIETGDTIKSSEYIMAFPGSWWEYAEGVTKICYPYESQYFQTIEGSEDCVHATRRYSFYPKNPSLIPFGIYVAGDSVLLLNGSSLSPSRMVAIVDTVPGVLYESIGANKGFEYSVVEKLDTITVNDVIYEDIVKVHYMWWENTYEFSVPHYYERNYYGWYAKGVGLIKYDEWTHPGSYHTIRTLSNHYIAPH